VKEKVDQEVDAIRSVLKALEPLSPDARSSVVDYVVKRLGLPFSGSRESPMTPLAQTGSVEATPPGIPVHLKDFTKQKNPRSANEMAAVVAYYLAELAPANQRKKRISADDIRTYFKIGDYPLPEVQFTLPNAKQAGYFDAVGDGQYQLNAVGHNLVAHSLPRSTGSAGGAKSERKRSPRKTRPTK
jgi:hypothetical protein